MHQLYVTLEVFSYHFESEGNNSKNSTDQPFSPTLSSHLVLSVVVERSIKLWAVKIYQKRIPEWPKWISFFGRTTFFVAVSRPVTKNCKTMQILNKRTAQKIRVLECFVFKKEEAVSTCVPVLLPFGHIFGASVSMNSSIVMARWNSLTASTLK